jgi:extracellular solute-binding protein (family 5)
VVVACRGAPRAALPLPGPAPSDTACIVAPGRTTPRDTLTLALTEAVDPEHAPLPRNVAERLVFAQLYETLIRVDCRGRVLPALARSWESADDRWTFTLRDDARFWDGAPVTARDVLAAWRSRDPSLAQTVTLLSDQAFSLQPSGMSFQRLADPTLALTKSSPGGGWPIGTGRHWVTSADAGTPDALWARPLSGVKLPAMDVTIVPRSAVRDAIDDNVDLLLTSDPAALEYARTRPQYVDLPLEWDVTYVLLAAEASSLDFRALRLESLPQAVQAEARPAHVGDDPPWFTDLKRCGAPTPEAHPAPPPPDQPEAGARPRRRIVYLQGDRDAGDLSARLVGLAVAGRGAVVAGLAPAAFEAALRTGAEAGYVLRLRRRVVDPCSAARDLPPWAPGGSITPLIDTRTHVLVRRGFPRLTLDWDGTLRFVSQ